MSEEYFDRPDETPGPQMQFSGPMGQFAGQMGPQMQHQGPMEQFPGPMGEFPGSIGQFPGSIGQFPGSIGQFPGPMGQFPGPMGQFPGPMGQFPGPMGQFPGPMGQFPGPMGPQMQHEGPFDHFGHEEHDEHILPPFRPGMHHFGQHSPTMRPPAFIVRRPIHHPGTIRVCVNRFVYIWFHDGRNFWAWIPYVSRRTIYGYRWNGHRWVYFEADVNEVETFVCI